MTMSKNINEKQKSTDEPGNPQWQGFVALSESFQSLENTSDAGKAVARSPQGSAMPMDLRISEATAGDRVQITELQCGEGNSRLIAMGLMPGTEVEIVSRTPSGSVIVSINDDRIGLSSQMASQIYVTLSRLVIEEVKMTNENSVKKIRTTPIGSTVSVVGYESTAKAYKRKLLAMGLTPGTELIVFRQAPLGDPVEIIVRGFHLSLRKEEAEALLIEPVIKGKTNE